MTAKRYKTAIACLFSALMLLTSCGGSTDSGSSSKAETTAAASESVSETAASSAQESPSANNEPSSQPVQEGGVLYDMGLCKEMFDNQLSGINTTITGTTVMQNADIDSRPYTLTIELENWSGRTSAGQIVNLSSLFWQVYPQMYERFGILSGASRDVTFVIDINYDGDVAGTMNDVIYLQDNWLGTYPDDYDCMTHELAHVIQNVWDADYLEYSDYIERFADYCRYVYAFDNGYYNGSAWRLQDVFTEDTVEKSVRFLVWLDYTYSEEENDLLAKFFDICYNKQYATADWADAWTEVFRNSPLEGKTIDEVWGIFAESDFAVYDSTSEQGEKSQLLINYDIRNKIKA